MKSDTTSRNAFVDYLRGIGIILVVLGHAIQFGSGAAYSADGAFFENIIFRIIYSFHMPLFLIISGYLMHFSVHKHTLAELAKSRCRGLLVPIISWGIIEFLIDRIILLQTPVTLHTPVSMVRYCLENNWFLWATLICSLVVGFVHYVLRDNTVIYAILLVLMFVTPDDFNFHLHKFVFPFFLAAFLIAEHPGRNRRSERKHATLQEQAARFLHSPVFWLLVALAYLILLYFFHTGSYIYVSRFTILGKDSPLRQIGIDLYRTALGAAGSLLCIGISSKVFTESNRDDSAWHRLLSRVSRWIQDLGRNSLGIYLISGILFQFVIANLWVNHSHSILLNFVETAVMLIFCGLLTRLISKSRVLSRLLLGGR